MAGYDSAGGASSELNVVLTDHLGARRAPDTLTSSTVSGESWETDPITHLSEKDLEKRIRQNHASALLNDGGASGAVQGASVGSPQIAPHVACSQGTK